MRILALDGNSIINRAFYGIRVLSTKDGVFTNAIYGFMNILLKLIENNNFSRSNRHVSKLRNTLWS